MAKKKTAKKTAPPCAPDNDDGDGDDTEINPNLPTADDCPACGLQMTAGAFDSCPACHAAL